MAHKRRSNGQGTLYKRTEAGPWLASWRDHEGKRREQSTHTTDRRAAERILAKRVADTALRREGVVDADLDAYAKEARRPICEHMEDYAQHLELTGSETHRSGTIQRLRRVIERANIGTWKGLTPAKVQRALAQITADNNLSPQTRNDYLTAAIMFAN